MPRAFWMRSIPRVTWPLLRGEQAGRLFADHARFVGVQDRLVEGRPAEGRTRLDDFVEAAILGFAERNGFAGAQIVPHDFRQELAATTDFRARGAG